MICEYAFSLRTNHWPDPYDKWAQSIESEMPVPYPVLQEFKKSRENTVFLKCPAHTDYLKNTFVFKSPIDIHFNLDFDQENAKIFCKNIDQTIFNNIVDLRFTSRDNMGNSEYPIIGLDFLNTFVSDQPVTVDITPAFMNHNDFVQKTSVIPGSYDISKWTRPIECVFEVRNKKCEIDIKKNDALYYIRFRTNDKIKFKKMNMPWPEIDICADLRAEAPFKSLKYRYRQRKNFNNGL